MTIEFINVGYGEAILIRQGDAVVLIDGGGNETQEFTQDASRIKCASYLRAQGITHIDAMIATHPHEDHICGLMSIAQALPIKAFYTSVTPTAKAKDIDIRIAPNESTQKFIKALNAHRQLLELCKEKSIIVGKLSSGTCLNINGMTLDVVAPTVNQADALEAELEAIYASDSPLEKILSLDIRLNNMSIVIRLEGEGVSALLVGDTNRDGYTNISQEKMSADIFKVGHHGQIDGIDEMRLKMIAPKYVVCCASSDRRYGSACNEVIRLVENQNAKMLFSNSPDEPYQAVKFTASAGNITVENVYI